MLSKNIRKKKNMYANSWHFLPKNGTNFSTNNNLVQRWVAGPPGAWSHLKITNTIVPTFSLQKHCNAAMDELISVNIFFAFTPSRFLDCELTKIVHQMKPAKNCVALNTYNSSYYAVSLQFQNCTYLECAEIKTWCGSIPKVKQTIKHRDTLTL